jgi:hypothetical protein
MPQHETGMIAVNVNNKMVFVRGVYRMAVIVEAVEESLGKQWRKRDEWLIVGLADDESKGLSTGLPFDPPRVETEPIGFKIHKP